jgi:phospholipase D1/2
VNAVIRAHQEQRKFRVIIVMPAIPGFPGDLREESALGTRAIIDYQYKSINRGEHSIYGQLEKEGIDPTKYVFVFNLRTYDRIHTTEGLRNKEKTIGVGYSELQATHAKDMLKSDAGGLIDRSVSPNKRQNYRGSSVPEDRRRIFNESGGTVDAKDTVAEDAMAGENNLADEPWDDGEDQEKLEYFQEELYVHAKVMIVDDETMVVGSSNINDRSQQGDHDSELSAVVKHKATVSGLRKYLWMEHLGLLPPQKLDGSEDPNAQPPGHSKNIIDVDPVVEDPMSDELWEMWTEQAKKNTEIYRDLFHTDPDDSSKHSSDRPTV